MLDTGNNQYRARLMCVKFIDPYCCKTSCYWGEYSLQNAIMTYIPPTGTVSTFAYEIPYDRVPISSERGTGTLLIFCQ